MDNTTGNYTPERLLDVISELDYYLAHNCSKRLNKVYITIGPRKSTARLKVDDGHVFLVAFFSRPTLRGLLLQMAEGATADVIQWYRDKFP